MKSLAMCSTVSRQSHSRSPAGADQSAPSAVAIAPTVARIAWSSASAHAAFSLMAAPLAFGQGSHVPGGGRGERREARINPPGSPCSGLSVHLLDTGTISSCPQGVHGVCAVQDGKPPLRKSLSTGLSTTCAQRLAALSTPCPQCRQQDRLAWSAGGSSVTHGLRKRRPGRVIFGSRVSGGPYNESMDPTVIREARVTVEELEASLSPRRMNDGFDRTPPQDIAAEQSVLGGMMLSKDAIADVVETLRGTDFYRPSHELVYEAILDLYGRGEPADAVTVSAELTKRGEISRIGGAPYLHTLISMVPTAANAGYYARIVRERAVLRRLVEAGTRIVQLGYAADGGDVDEIVNTAQSEIYAVTEQRASEDYHRLGDVIGGAVDEIEAAGHRGVGMVGVPTGFADLDRLTNGLHPGQMIVIAARPAIGKALALDTPLATPPGWTTMGDVQVGDQLIAADGTPTVVVAATPVMIDRPCYRVTFDDGTDIVADAQHEWATRTRAMRRLSRGAAAEIRTSEQLAATLHCATADRRANHSVDVAAALELPTADLPLAPYALGVWLGDGHSASARFTSADPEIAMRIEGLGLVACEQRSPAGAARLYSLRLPEPEEIAAHHGTVAGILRSLGVMNNKHIPTGYLRA